MNPTDELLRRVLARESLDERGAAPYLLRRLAELERCGAIVCRHRALRRLARLAPPDLRRELFLRVGMDAPSLAREAVAA